MQLYSWVEEVSEPFVNSTNEEPASVRKPSFEDINKNSIDTRSALPLQLQETDELDPEERAHMNIE